MAAAAATTESPASRLKPARAGNWPWAAVNVARTTPHTALAIVVPVDRLSALRPVAAAVSRGGVAARINAGIDAKARAVPMPIKAELARISHSADPVTSRVRL